MADLTKGVRARVEARRNFPFKIGEHVQLKDDLPLRTALWAGTGELPLSPMAGKEGRILSMNVSDAEVQVKGVGWCEVADLFDPSEVAWEEDEMLDDEGEILDDEDEILEED